MPMITLQDGPFHGVESTIAEPKSEGERFYVNDQENCCGSYYIVQADTSVAVWDPPPAELPRRTLGPGVEP